MKVNKIAIACFKKDMYLLRPCVASIRYWYPDIEIFLIKDFMQGKFSTKEIEDVFNVKIFNTQRKFFGWPWSKLAVVFHNEKEKFLFLDSDTVLVGKVVDRLNEYEDDFIVTGIKQEDKKNLYINRDYIDMEKMEAFDPAYHFPGYGFNGGQIVMTSGILKEKDFDSVIDLEPLIVNKHPGIFKHGDQGILNYVFAKAHQKNKIKVKFTDFWIWARTPEAEQLSLESIKAMKGTPYVLHWAGSKPVDFRELNRYDIFRFYEDFYYSHLPLGNFKKKWSHLAKLTIAKLKILKYKLLKIDYKDM